MNLVGKIFVILVFVMSIAFMTFAVAIYATHKNWKVESEGWKKKYDIAVEDLQKAEAKRKTLEEEYKAEISRRVADLGKLQTKVDRLEEENRKLEE